MMSYEKFLSERVLFEPIVKMDRNGDGYSLEKMSILRKRENSNNYFTYFVPRTKLKTIKEAFSTLNFVAYINA